jgi:hypothetical protein
MVSVASLLNPVKDEEQKPYTTQSFNRTPPSTPRSGMHLPHPPPSKKQKMSKDAPVFVEAETHGEVRYPPWESYDSTCEAELNKFSVYPMGRMKRFPRRIPYNSEKKDFYGKTGRGAFEGISCRSAI